MSSNQTTTSTSSDNNNSYNNSTSVVIDFNDEGSLKRALIRTLGTAELLKSNITRDVYEMWQDRIFDAIRQCKMEYMTIDTNETFNMIKSLLETTSLLSQTNNPNNTNLSNSEIQRLNQARAVYSFMRDQVDSILMISIKNLHINGNPLDLIRALKTKFSPATQVTVFQSLQNLLSVKLIPNEPKHDFINRIKGLYHNVLHYNQTKSIEQLLDVLLNLVLYQNVEPNYQQQLKRDLYNDVNFNFIQAAKIVLAEEELVKLANLNNINKLNVLENKSISELKANAAIQDNHLNNNNYTKFCKICKRSNHYTSDCFYNNSNNYNNISYIKRKAQNGYISHNNYNNKLILNTKSNNDSEVNDSGDESDNSNSSFKNNYKYSNRNNSESIRNNKRVRFHFNHSNNNKYNKNNYSGAKQEKPAQ